MSPQRTSRAISPSSQCAHNTKLKFEQQVYPVVCNAASNSAAILLSRGEAGPTVSAVKKQRAVSRFPYNPAGGRVVRILQNTLRGLGRIFPDCITLSQAIAFNMFLAFFPVLLFLLGVLSSTAYFHNAVREIPQRLTTILPPGSDQIVVQYFVRRGLHPLKWITLGLAGALLAGSQVMVGFIEGFRLIEGDLLRLSFWRLYFRATILLSLTAAPFLAVVVLTVFGKQARGWLIKRIGLSTLIHALGFAAYIAIVFLLAMCVLVVMYRFGRPGERSYREVLPGALVATVLWWAADISFGFYVRKMPYDVVYGGLAAAIGLLLWMYLTSIVVLVGAAYNAEARESLQVHHKGLRIWQRAT